MHYVALPISSSVGEWRVVFPDVPECQAHGYTVNDATFAATTALSRCLAENGHLPPLPRDLAEIERDEEWLSRHNIDLHEVIVTRVRLVLVLRKIAWIEARRNNFAARCGA